jgi:hypothetical protein
VKTNASPVIPARFIALLVVCGCSLSGFAFAQVGTWSNLTNGAPVASTALLLTDGSVMVHGSQSTIWYRLKPDASGSYIKGTWTQLASMHDSRLYYASVVLNDGRVFVGGGEYGTGGSTVEMYDPATNVWTQITSWTGGDIGDSTAKVMPDGRVLLLPRFGGYWIYNPNTDVWVHGTSSKGSNDEQSVALMPNGSFVVPWDSGSQIYNPSTDQWTGAGTPPNGLIGPGSEIGPAVLLYDGRVFCLGASGHTDFYNTSTGAWTAGPDIPGLLACDDAPAAVMPNGRVLFGCDHNNFTGPTTIYEFDPTTNTYTDTVNGTGNPVYVYRMLVLPTGQVLVSNGGSIQIYTPAGSPSAAWQPTISSVSSNADGSYTLTGTQLNGLTEGAYYGDDAQMSTNYPIVRLVNGNNVYYTKSYNFSTMGLATGSTSVSTRFSVSGIPNGSYSLYAVANGIASNAFTFNIGSAVPSITSALTASGTVNTAFSYTITATNTPTSYGASGLPAGLSVNTGNGVISGTPTVTGTFNVTISATNGSGTGSATLVLTIKPPPPSITSALTANGTTGVAFSYTITATNSPTSYGASGLPAGLSVNTGTGVISGTPSAAGTSNVTISATNSGGTGSATLVLTIKLAAPAITSALTAFGPVNSPFSYTITATNSPTSFNATGLPAGLSVNTGTGVISGTPTATGTSNVNISATNATGTGSATLVLTITNGLVLYWKLDETSGTVAADSSGNGYNGTVINGGAWSAGEINGGLSLNAASSQYVVTASSLSSQFAGGNVTIAVWFKATTGGVIVDELGGQALNASWHDSQIEILDDGTVHVRVWNNAGLTLGTVSFGTWNHAILRYNNATQTTDGFLNGVKSAGSVSGAKQWPGALYYALGGTDTTNLGSGAYFNGVVDDLHIYNRALSDAEASALATPIPVITSPLSASGTAGSFFSYTITASSSPTSFNATSLPAGLSIDTATGIISGTPTSGGVTSATISATNAAGTGSAILTITLNGVPVITSPPTASPNPATVGQTVTFMTAATDPDADALTYTWGFGDATAGSGATATHAYAAAGTYTATVTISDGRGGTVSANVTVTVNAVSVNTVHVSAIAMSIKKVGNGKAAIAKVTIVDNNNAPITGATVSGAWSSLTTGSASGTTGSGGIVSFQSAKSTKVGSFTFTVNNVAIAGYSYDPSQNVVTTASITTSGAVTLGPAAAAAAPTDAIAIGPVPVNQRFKLKLPSPATLPQSGHVKATAKVLPSGIRVGGSYIGGRPKSAGTFVLTVQFQVKTFSVDASGKRTANTTNATQTYALTVKP